MTVGFSAGMSVRSDPRRWVILAAVCFALITITIDNTIMNVAVPTIEAELAASPAQLQAVINAYVVVFAALLVAGGLLADRYGRRRTVIVGLVGLVAASVAAALAPAAEWLIIARAVMGIGAALVMPGTLAILVHTFAPAERVKAFAVWSAVGSTAMAIGPVVGGYLVDSFGWPAIFGIGAVLSAMAAVLVAVVVPESGDSQQRSIDVGTTAAIAVGMAAFVSAIILVADHGLTSPIVLGCVVLTLGAGALFWGRQRRASMPMIDTGLYRNRQFAGASIAVSVLAIGTGSVLFILTQYLQHVLAYPPLQAGMAIIPLAVGVVGASYAGAWIPRQIGSRWAIVAGFTVTAGGFGVLAALEPLSSYLVVAAGLFLAGCGSGIAAPAVHSTVLGAVPTDRAGMGSALNDTHQQLGIAFGVAMIGTIVTACYRSFAPAEVRAEPGMPIGDTLSAVRSADSADSADSAVRHAAQHAFTQAQSVGMLVCAGLALVGAAIAWRALRPASGR